jgi:hypothetical protein
MTKCKLNTHHFQNMVMHWHVAIAQSLAANCTSCACAFRGLWELGEFAQSISHGGMSFGNVASHGNGMATVWIIFVLEWPVYMALAWYLERVLDSGSGIRRRWLFCFGRRRGSKCARCTAGCHSGASSLPNMLHRPQRMCSPESRRSQSGSVAATHLCPASIYTC